MNTLRLLLWLRWRYLWRAGGTGARVGLVIAWLMLGAVAVFTAMGLRALMGSGRFAERPEIVHLVIFGVYASWLYLGTLSEVFDPTRLFIYPVPTRKMFLLMSVTSLAGPATGFGIAIAVGLLGWPGTAAQDAARAALMAMVLVHLVMVSRVVRLALLNVLTSRRWRDVLLTMSTLTAAGIYLAVRFMSSEAANVFWTALDGEWASRYLVWFPSVWASHAFLDPFSAPGAAGVLAFGLMTAVVYVVGGWLEDRVYFSEPVFAYKAKKRREAGPLTEPAIPRWMPGPIAAGFFKEWKTLWRDPTVRYRLITNFAYILIPVIASLVVQERMFHAMPQFLGYGLLFCEMLFIMNVFGADGPAMATLALYPAKRWQVLAGKNVCALLVFGTLNLVAVVAAAVAVGQTSVLLREVVSNLGCLVILLGAGNLFSIHFPSRMYAPGQRVGRGEEMREGVLKQWLRGLVLAGVTLLLAPAVAALYLPQWLNLHPVWFMAAVPFALFYAGGLYVGALLLGDRELRRKEESLVAFYTAS